MNQLFMKLKLTINVNSWTLHNYPCSIHHLSPRKEWAAHFETRNLEVYSAYPLLAHPTHYVGDEGWFSDTGT